MDKTRPKRFVAARLGCVLEHNWPLQQKRSMIQPYQAVNCLEVVSFICMKPTSMGCIRNYGKYMLFYESPMCKQYVSGFPSWGGARE